MASSSQVGIAYPVLYFFLLATLAYKKTILEKVTCPICKNSDGRLIKPSFLPKFYICKVCTGHFLNRPQAQEYPEEYFRQKEAPSTIAHLAIPLLNYLRKLKVEKIKSTLEGKKNPKILDYGCGSGELVKNLITHGIKAVGFEPSKEAHKITRGKKLPIYSKVKLMPGGYDLVMFWHSLEHTDKPLAILRSIKSCLKKDGKVLIAVPNAASIEARFGKEKWFHYTYPLHCVQFTPYAIGLMLRRADFKLMKLDFFNPEYTLSGLAQTFLNIFLPENTLYSVVSHRRLSMPLPKAVFVAAFSLLTLLVFSPILLAVFLIELISKNTGAMVIIAKNES